MSGAKETTEVERGGFLLKNRDPKMPYKVVEEKRTAKGAATWDKIELQTFLALEGEKTNRYLPPCESQKAVDWDARGQKRVDYTWQVAFWWHTHVTGWIKDARGNPATGAPVPGEDDRKNDYGVPGLMVRYDDVEKQLRIYVIDTDGAVFEVR